LNVGRDASSIPNGEQEIKAEQAVANMWRDEGDDFFGNQPSAQAALDAEVNEDIGEVATGASAPPPPVKKKRKPRGSNKKKVTGAAGSYLAFLLHIPAQLMVYVPTLALGDNLPQDL